MEKENLEQELVKERRRERRWKNIRFVGWMVIVVMALGTMKPVIDWAVERGTGSWDTPEEPYVATVKVNGQIGVNRPASADRVIEGLNAAFKDAAENAPSAEKRKEDAVAEGVLIRINSPGGSPVQSHRIYERIQAFKTEHPDIPVVVYGEEALASGAYYAAAAADRIYVSPATVTGSIGVIMQGYQYKELLNWLKVEPRVVTAGKNKDRMVGTRKWSEADRAKMKGVVTEIHGQFIQAVKNGRGQRLKTGEAELFSGDFWTGAKAKELGLVDGLGTPRSVLKAEFGTTEVLDHTAGSDWQMALQRATGAVVEAVTNTLATTSAQGAGAPAQLR